MAAAAPSRLDPAVARLIKALARADADRDFRAMEATAPIRAEANRRASRAAAQR